MNSNDIKLEFMSDDHVTIEVGVKNDHIQNPYTVNQVVCNDVFTSWLIPDSYRCYPNSIKRKGVKYRVPFHRIKECSPLSLLESGEYNHKPYNNYHDEGRPPRHIGKQVRYPSDYLGIRGVRHNS